MEASLISPLGRTVLGSTKLTIGRAADNNLVVTDPTVSSHHAEIRPEGQGYSIVDLGSTNGTFINGQPLVRSVPRRLHPGDTIRIGDLTFMYEASGAPGSASTAYDPSQGAASGYLPPVAAPPQTDYGNPSYQQPPPSPSYPGAAQSFSAQPPYGAPPPKSSGPSLSSLFSAAGDALEKVFSGRGRRRRKEFQLSLFAIARAVLEEEDRAFVGKSYTVQAGIAQSKPENFAGEPFSLSVQSLEPLLFDVLLHTSENIEPVKEWQKRLRYDPRNPNPQVVEFTFRLVAPGHSSLVINFYRERRLLKTIRFEFDAIEKSMLTTVSSRG